MGWDTPDEQQWLSALPFVRRAQPPAAAPAAGAQTTDPNAPQFRAPEKMARTAEMPAQPAAQRPWDVPGVAVAQPPTFDEAVSETQPNQANYQPKARSAGRKILDAMAAGLVGYANPGEGLRLAREERNAPKEEAQERFSQDEAQWERSVQQEEAQQNRERQASLDAENKANTDSQIALRNAGRDQYGMVPVTMPDGSQVMVQRKDAERMQAALQANQTRGTIADKSNAAKQTIADKDNRTRTNIAAQTNQTRRDIAATRTGPGARGTRGGARAMTPEQMAAGKAKAIAQQQNAFRALSSDVSAGKIKVGTPQYLDREVAIQDAFASSMRAARQEAVPTQDVVDAYKRKYGTGQPVIQAMQDAGWEIPGQ